MLNEIDKWLDRISNLLEFQKDTGEEVVTMRLNRYELISLNVIFNTLKDLILRGGRDGN